MMLERAKPAKTDTIAVTAKCQSVLNIIKIEPINKTMEETI